MQASKLHILIKTWFQLKHDDFEFFWNNDCDWKLKLLVWKLGFGLPMRIRVTDIVRQFRILTLIGNKIMSWSLNILIDLLKKICQAYHERVYVCEGQKWDLEREVRKRDYEVFSNTRLKANVFFLILWHGLFTPSHFNAPINHLSIEPKLYYMLPKLSPIEEYRNKNTISTVFNWLFQNHFVIDGL